MTICVSVRIPEALVLAADSMASLMGVIDTPQGQQRGIFQTFEFANKVCQIKDYPIGAMSWGIASISNRSIQSLIMEFEYSYPDVKANKKYKVKEIADSLLATIQAKYNSAHPTGSDQPLLGLYVGGYSADEFFSEQYFFEFPNSQD